uniref:Uncharacterized protein n=1 Tax=Arundo donax TaxID=35708 RepID=A0A0A8YU37_ARUDO
MNLLSKFGSTKTSTNTKKYR